MSTVQDRHKESIGYIVDTFGWDKINWAFEQLINQGGKSQDEWGSCAYRADSTASCDKRCLFGWLIPDHKYTEYLETYTAAGAMCECGLISDDEPHEKSLHDAQGYLHDGLAAGSEVEFWQECLEYMKEIKQS